MALQRITLSTPCSLRGIDQDFPPEIREPMIEVIRRMETNREAMIRDLRDQVVVDTSILPTTTKGEASTSTLILATSSDIDNVAMEALIG